MNNGIATNNSIASVGPGSSDQQITLGINAVPSAAGSLADKTATGFTRLKRFTSHLQQNVSVGSTGFTNLSSFISWIDLETPQPKPQGYTLVYNPIKIPSQAVFPVPTYGAA